MIRQRTMWWVAALAVAVLCIAGAGLEIYRDYCVTRDAIVAQTDATARLAHAHAQRSLGYLDDSYERLKQTVIGLDKTDAHNLIDLRNRLQDMTVASETIGTIWLIDAEGMRWLNNVPTVLRGVSSKDRPYFARAREAPGSYFIGPVEIGIVTPRPRFTLSHALTDSTGVFQGVLAIGVNTEPFDRLYESLRTAPNVQIAAFNQTGDLLAKTPDIGADVIQIARAAAAGSREEGGSWITSALQVPGFPMTLVALTNFDDALGRWRYRAGQVGLLSLVMLLGFVMLAMAGARSADREMHAQERLRQLNENLEERVRERTQSLNLLLRELNHRVKNNLQIVGSLLRLQARGQNEPEVKDILERTNQRLFAIADLHSELETGDTGSASSRLFFDRITRRILDVSEIPGRRIALTTDFDDLPLPVDRAVPLGLILNELVTNSVKHAFRSRTYGSVAVRFKAADGIMELSVSDDGEGSGQPSPSSGIGSQIVAMLTRQIHGTVAVSHAGGRHVRIVAPLSVVASNAPPAELARAAE